MAASLMLPKNANLNIECIVQEQTKLRNSTVVDSSFAMDDPKGSPPQHPSTQSLQRLAINVSSNQCVVKFASKNQNSEMDFSNPGPSNRKGTSVDLIQYSATTSTISSPTPASVGGTTPTVERESYQKRRSLRSNSLVERRQLRKFSRQASVVQESALRNSTLKAFIVVFLTFGAFIIAWTPFLVLAVRSIGQPDKVSDTEGSIALLIGSLSSITDPFIYGLINQPFRSAAKRRILRRFFNIIAMDM
ncbi:uncharacterized protein LOC131949678 [Physella acuta]|uniref:uncharacterized protein LOC131949678 n=1 Tax=Physella acuta TaxID=109671 RepID=UPI0027DBC0D8|nr:uncharacterized protein LOC131949678 [Physella acuta]